MTQIVGWREVIDEECSCVPEAPLPDTSPIPEEGKEHQSSTSGVAQSSSDGGVSLLAGIRDSGREGFDGDDSDIETPRDLNALRQRLREKDRRR